MAGGGLVEDLSKLSNLDETVILHTLKRRYEENLIYTYVGDILVAINPFTDLDIYDKDVASQYKFVQKKSSLPPHIYALADLAYQSMLGKRGMQPANQCLFISGESGSGKTESSKLLLRHLIELCKGNAQLEQQVLQVNPLLEAFGNAPTLMNDNSSRFGKFLQLKFYKGQVLGAKISEYLLEKSRLVKQSAGEGNFHVFSYLFAGKTPDDLNQLKLTPGKIYRYLSNGLKEENSEFSKDKYTELVNALDLVGFKDQDQRDMFTILAGILHLGEVVFSADESDFAVIDSGNSLEEVAIACSQLGIDASEVRECLTSSQTVTKGEFVKRHYTIYQAQDFRDAMAKALYARLFGWIVYQINSLLASNQLVPPYETQEIGILDIFGFEHFERNSFEQACINVTNEQLQLFFNEYVFKMEQEEYQREGIDWTLVNFIDNTHLLDLFLEKPIGILSLLDEQCSFPTGSDRSFVDKLNSNFASCSYYTKSKHSGLQFTIHHYAAKVTYDGTHWLEKNRDTFPAGIMEVLRSSTNRLIKHLYDAKVTRHGSLAFHSKKTTIRKPGGTYQSKSEGTKRKLTVSAQFRNSLVNLLERMKSASPIFIRCLKPNQNKSPHQFDSQYVLAQLLYTGMLETTKIRQNGFSVRATFQEFINKYKLLIGCSNPAVSPEVCQEILNSSGATGWHIGKTKVFLKTEHTEFLSEKLQKKVMAVINIQRLVRGFLSRLRVKYLTEKAKIQESDLVAMATQVEEAGLKLANQQLDLSQHDAQKHTDSTNQRLSAIPERNSEVDHSLTPPPSPHLPIHPKETLDAKYSVVIKPAKKDSGSRKGNGTPRSTKSYPMTDERSVPPTNNYSDSDEDSASSDEFGNDESDIDFYRDLPDPIPSWFRNTQIPGLLGIDGFFPAWFHGMIPRRKAESLLNARGTIGGFLLRVSQAMFGYCLSFRAEDRCRHYIVNQLSNGKYVVIGETKAHPSLLQLVQYYQKNKLSNWAGYLTIACKQEKDIPDYVDLIDEEIIKETLTNMKRKQPLANTVTDNQGYLVPSLSRSGMSKSRQKRK